MLVRLFDEFESEVRLKAIMNLTPSEIFWFVQCLFVRTSVDPYVGNGVSLIYSCSGACLRRVLKRLCVQTSFVCGRWCSRSVLWGPLEEVVEVFRVDSLGLFGGCVFTSQYSHAISNGVVVDLLNSPCAPGTIWGRCFEAFTDGSFNEVFRVGFGYYYPSNSYLVTDRYISNRLGLYDLLLYAPAWDGVLYYIRTSQAFSQTNLWEDL